MRDCTGISEKYDNIRTVIYYYGDTIFIGETAHTVMAIIANDSTTDTFIINDYGKISDLYEMADEYNEIEDAQNVFKDLSAHWWELEEQLSALADDIYSFITEGVGA